jgi:hypothetical protein
MPARSEYQALAGISKRKVKRPGLAQQHGLAIWCTLQRFPEFHE